jgi:hypothetical protein
MLFYAAFTTHPHTAIEQVRDRHDTQYRADALHPETWRGFYEFAGGGAGFLLIEAEEVRAVTAILQPYQDLIRWDVRAVHSIDVETFIDQVRQRNG